MKRIMIFIDYRNLVSSNYQIDIFQIPPTIQDHLFNIAGTEIDLIRTYVFMNHPTLQNQAFIDTMANEHYFIMSTQNHQTYIKDHKHINHEKGVDVALACQMLSLAYQNAYDIAVLVTGDADLYPAIKEVQRIGKRVMLASFEDKIAKIYKEPNHTNGCLDFDIFYFDNVIEIIAAKTMFDKITPKMILEEVNTEFFDGNIDYDNVKIKKYIAYWAARARYLQSNFKHLNNEQQNQIKYIFDQLNKLSSKYQPGYIKALNKEWMPNISWEEEIKRISKTW